MSKMKEKERFELFGEHCIKDNDINARCQLLDVYKACVTLNEQDKHIKELEEIYKHIMSGEHIPANIAKKSLKLSEQAQNQKAIEELNNLKRYCHEWYRYSYSDVTKRLNTVIDDRIKELKGEEK